MLLDYAMKTVKFCVVSLNTPRAKNAERGLTDNKLIYSIFHRKPTSVKFNKFDLMVHFVQERAHSILSQHLVVGIARGIRVRPSHLTSNVKNDGTFFLIL